MNPSADNEKIEELPQLWQKDMGDKFFYTEEELNMLHARATEYMKGGAETYTPEESHIMIRQ